MTVDPNTRQTINYANQIPYFTKHSDKALHLLGKTISYEGLSNQSSELLPNNPYKSPRIGLHDYISNLTPCFLLEWFTDAFIKLFGYP